MARVIPILTMQRCKSAWLANLLDYLPSASIHEPSRLPQSFADLREGLARVPFPYVFVIDPTAAGHRLEEWVEAFGAPSGIIERPYEEVVASMEIAFPSRRPELIEFEVEEVMRGLARLDGPRLTAAQVTEEEPLREFLAKLAPALPFPVARFRRLRDLRVEVMPSRYGE